MRTKSMELTMPYVQVTTREPISQETKAALARALSEAVMTVEVGSATEGGKPVDWMWFRVLPENDWAVGGEFGSAYVRGRTMCFAQIIAPEWLMNRELKARAIAEVTRVLREGLAVGRDDDGTGIWVILTEVPSEQWGLSGKTITLPELIDKLEGEVSPARRAEMKAHADGRGRIRETFGIPE